MAGSKIRIDDLFEAGVFTVGDDIDTTAKVGIEANKKLKESYDNIAKAIEAVVEANKKLSGSQGKGSAKGGKGKSIAESAEDQGEAIKKLSELEKERARILKNLEKAVVKKSLADTKGAKALARLREDTRAINALNKQQAIINSKLTGAYRKLGAQLVLARKNAKDLGAQYGINSRQFKQAAASANVLDKRIKSLDAAVGQHGRKVGQYTNALKGGIATAKRFASALGIMGGAFLAARIGRDTFRRIRDFGREMYDIAGIIGITREEMIDLEDVIKDVAAGSIRTSNEVAELAQALITLGKTKDEVKALLEPVNNLSIALRATPEAAGELLITTLNTFGAGVDQAERYANVIAAARQKTALNFTRIRDALNYIAPSAKTLNMSLEQTSAVLGVLVNNGIKAAQAGRVMRTAFGKLAKEGLTLDKAIEQMRSIDKEGLSMADLISSLNAGDDQALSLKKLSESARLFGHRAGPLADILSRNGDELRRLTAEMYNADGVLDKFINEQLKSLDSQLKILDSAWEKYILDVNEASGASNILKNVVTFLAENIADVIKWVGIAAGAWLYYKTMVRLATIQQNLQARASLRQATAVKLAGANASRAAISWQRFTLALKANWVGLALTGVALAIGLFMKFNKSTKEMSEANKEAALQFEKTRIETEKHISKVTKLVREYEELKIASEDNSDAQGKLLRVIKELSTEIPDTAKVMGEYGDVVDVNTIAIKENLKARIELNKVSALGNIQKEEKNIEKLNEDLERFQKAYKTIERGQKLAEKNQLKGLPDSWFDPERLGKASDEILKTNDLIKKAEKRIENYGKKIEGLDDLYTSVNFPLIAEALALGIDKQVVNQAKLNGVLEETIRLEKIRLGLIDDDGNEIRYQNISELLNQIRNDEIALAEIRSKVVKEDKYYEETPENIKKLETRISNSIKLYETLTGVSLKSAKAVKKVVDRHKEYMDAVFEMNQWILKEQIRINKEIVAQDNIHLKTRQEAAQKVLDDELKLQTEALAYKMKTEDGFNKEWVKTIKERGVLTKEQYDILEEEGVDDDKKRYAKLHLLYLKYLKERRQSFKEYTDSQFSIVETSEARDLALLTDMRQTQMNEALANESKNYRERQNNYAKYAEDDKAARKLYLRQVAQIEFNAKLDSLNISIGYWKKLLENTTEKGKDYVEIMRKIAEAEAKIEGLNIGDLTTDNIESKTEKLEEILRGVLDLVVSINEFGNVMFQNKMLQLEEEQNATDSYYQNILDNEHLTEAERERIQKKKERSQEAHERRIAKVKERQAKYDKAMAMVQAAINTAVAITRAGANPFLIALAATTGAIQLAAIASQKIPAYFEGTDFHKGGKALVGEVRPEVIIEPNKNPYTVDKPTLKNLPRGTQVIPSVDDYNKMISASMLASVGSDNQKLRDYQASMGYGKYDKAMLEEMRLSRRAFERQRGTTVVTQRVDINHEIFRNNNIRWS